MAELYENQDLEEKVLLLGVSTQEEDMEASWTSWRSWPIRLARWFWGA